MYKAMFKITIILIAGILALILLFPVPQHMDDGGTVVYKAMLYEVHDLKRLNGEYFESGGQKGDMYIEGIIIKILGFEVYNSTKD